MNLLGTWWWSVREEATILTLRGQNVGKVKFIVHSQIDSFSITDYLDCDSDWKGSATDRYHMGECNG